VTPTDFNLEGKTTMNTRSVLLFGLLGLGACAAELDPHSDTVAPAAPATCRDVRAFDHRAPDGDYTLYVDHDTSRPWKAYCHDMAGTPREYLSVSNEYDDANLSTLETFDGNHFAKVSTRYQRIRVDPASLTIDIADQTFSKSAGAAVLSGQGTVSSMPLGVGATCSSTLDFITMGQANIDLAGTPFALNTAFCLQDADSATSNYWFSYDQTRMDGFVFPSRTNACASVSPEPCGPFQGTGSRLELIYR